MPNCFSISLECIRKNCCRGLCMECFQPYNIAKKVAIIGAGFVGSTTAYALMIDGAVSEIALIDVRKDKVEGEALDLAHCMQFTQKTTIIAGDSFELVKDAEVIIITAGIAQKKDQTRSALLETNVQIFKQIIPEIIRHNDKGILLVVSNPLDVLTYLTLKLSGLSSCKVLGSGTVLDTARLRYLTGQFFNVSPKDITAYILGEHGDAEFAWWSRASIAGVPLHLIDGYSPQMLATICEQTKNAAYDIIAKKGATNYAIALALTKIVKAILQDQSRVFTVSSYLEDYQGLDDVCLSIPTIVRKNGICQRLPIDLSKDEKEKMQRAAEKIKQEIKYALTLL